MLTYKVQNRNMHGNGTHQIQGSVCLIDGGMHGIREGCEGTLAESVTFFFLKKKRTETE